MTTTITATAAGRITQTVTAKKGRKTVTHCSATRTITAGPTMTLTCKLGAAARAAVKRASLRLTVTTTYTPAGGAAQQVVATMTAKRG